MLVKGSLKICRPAEAINEIDRTTDRGRLMAYAVEHLMFSHPYKKFDLVLHPAYGMDDGVGKIAVFDFEQLVCTIGTYTPDGAERNSMQLQFEYNYHVHSKAPKDTKRTSNVNKILECVRLIRPADADRHKNMAGKLSELIEEATKFAAAKRSFESVFSNIAYDKVQNNVALFDDLLNGRDTSAVAALRDKFYSKHKDYEAALKHTLRLRKYSAMVVKNHSGDYRVVHRHVVPKPNSNEWESVYSLTDYDAKDKLPPNLHGKLCLLEIAEQNEGKEHSIEGVGSVNTEYTTTPIYRIIGEDLEVPELKKNDSGT